MTDPFSTATSVTESFDDLIRRIADRDQAAFRRLYRRLVHQTFTQVRESLGSAASAVPVTRAVFVDIWLLAPLAQPDHGQALAWVSAIAARRTTDRLHTLRGPQS